MIFDLPSDVCIAANAADIGSLEGAPGMQGLGNATCLPIEAGTDLPASALSAAKVLVIEVDPTVPASLRRISKIRSERENLKIIAAIKEADVALVRTLIRQGITDVATLPFEPEELASQILEALTPLRRKARDVSLAPVTMVVRSIGGCGATTLATHLAAALAGQQSGNGKRGDKVASKVCLVDFDLQSGAVASYLGLSPKVNIATLIEASDRLDDEILRNVVNVTSYGFSVITAPDMITPLDSVSLDQLSKVLTLLRKSFTHVIVDLPGDWTEWTLSIAVEASDILLVTDISISGLRQARRRIDLLTSVGVIPAAIKVVANRMERRFFKTIGVDDIQHALHCDVAAALDDEGAAMRTAQDQGVLIADTMGKSRYASQVEVLAQMLCGEGN